MAERSLLRVSTEGMVTPGLLSGWWFQISSLKTSVFLKGYSLEILAFSSSQSLLLWLLSLFGWSWKTLTSRIQSFQETVSQSPQSRLFSCLFLVDLFSRHKRPDIQCMKQYIDCRVSVYHRLMNWELKSRVSTITIKPTFMYSSALLASSSLHYFTEYLIIEDMI